ncbi:DEAD/DEAH box helicase [Aquibium sp. ELW1220]|uniref:DEAD/DEAH box helicase n=1 Tax=Aquibium sp. ELW1220 TaxID=2976766 RepID=UPI0025AFCD0A|nr:DEAD/DEAH box helicase [Aquibium sp. ELW1220]MDN2582689.1 DEAD/DEAH box helicase [Aquibium sp. ELW1220]
MQLRLEDHFDGITLLRGKEYARRGHVVSVEAMEDGSLRGEVSNGRGDRYRQTIRFVRGAVAGDCSCPVGFNCKHVAAVLVVRADSEGRKGKLAGPVLGWLTRVRERPEAAPPAPPPPEDYPDKVKDRLVYVLSPNGPQMKVDLCKGRVNAAGTALNKGIRRYDLLNGLRGGAPAGFVRPVDLDLLAGLAQARLWEPHYGFGLPDLLRPRGENTIALLRGLCETGRFLHADAPDAVLTWSDARPQAQLGWRMTAAGGQRLGFQDASGRPLELRSAAGATLWIDRQNGLIGTLEGQLGEDVLKLVDLAPEIAPHEVKALAEALPERLAGLSLPPPGKVRQTRRVATRRFARLVLGAETARVAPRYWSDSAQLPTLVLRFVYDEQEVRQNDPAPRLVADGEIVTILRDRSWEAECTRRLLEAGALRIGDLGFHRPGEAMMKGDFVFADGEIVAGAAEPSDIRSAIDFAFRTVPDLRAEGWDIVETPKWPYRLSEETASLSVETRSEAGEAFQGADWFSLGFQVEIGGRQVDVAPLIAAFLDQARGAWDVLPDEATLAGHLARRPIYLDRGRQGYVAVDLSPLAPLLHLFLTHHAELGVLHPSDAAVARLAEEALAGSSVRFADKAGILPLARSLQALADADGLDAPAGLEATLRRYQAYGAAWMSRLLEQGFGGVLADDMGLGKTVQTLALLQARRNAGAQGPALLIVPTSLLHGWQAQAARFTPNLRLAVLHGAARAAMRDEALTADLVVTTYPLLSRDRDWLAGLDWPLVILDEAQILKNPASQMAKTLREIPARGRLALTGTPLENSLQDLWTLVDWINPGLLGDRKRFQTLFRTPIEKHGDVAAQARLRRRLRPFMLRRTKEEVAAELPPKTEILERVDLPKPQQLLYETVRSAMDARVREAIAARGLAAARITVLDALLKLRQVCCDPALVKSEAARAVTDSAKRTRLFELLCELVAEGRRVLVFSQFVEMLRLIEADLAEAGIRSLSLTGSTTKRGDVLDAFAKGDAPVFLLSLKAGGVGLTLTEADTVILYDPWWNPAVERQAMDRTHRIGQTKPVFVHRLVAAGTVEEKILDMQARKQALADALFDDEGDAAHDLLDEATLQDLFAPLTA